MNQDHEDYESHESHENIHVMMADDYMCLLHELARQYGIVIEFFDVDDSWGFHFHDTQNGTCLFEQTCRSGFSCPSNAILAAVHSYAVRRQEPVYMMSLCA